MNKKIKLKKLSKFRMEVIFNRIVEVLGFNKQSRKAEESDDGRHIK